MKVFVKTLKGTPFEIEVKLQDTVADVKKNIETIHGPEVYPAGRQMLIHEGKVLKDETTMEENEVSDNSFMVIMLTPEKNTTAPPPTPAAAPPLPPPPTSATNTPYNEAASNKVEPIDLLGVIHQILRIGEGTWNRATVERALDAAFNNPERAIEYLYSGIPDSPNLPPVAGIPPPPPPPNLPPVAGIPPPPQPTQLPPPISNSDTLNLFPQGLPAGAGENLDFLRDSPQFQAFRSRIRADPQILRPMVQEFERQNPNLRRLIRDHRSDFYCMIFETDSFVMTLEDIHTIDRLEAMGFPQSVLWDVYFCFDKNEEATANYLLDHLDEFED